VNDHQLDLGSSFSAADPKRRHPGRLPVRELTPGSSVESVYLLSSKETRQTKAGKPFFKLRVSDRTGTVECTVWETDWMHPGIEVGDLVLVTARVTEYQNKAQLEASRVAPAPPGSAQPRDFLPSTYRDVDELRGFLQFHIESVQDRDYRALL